MIMMTIVSVSHLRGVYAVVCVHVRMAEGVLHTRGGLHTHHGNTHARLVYCKFKNKIRNELKSRHHYSFAFNFLF